MRLFRNIIFISILLSAPFSYLCAGDKSSFAFVHPGMEQGKEDLEYIRSMVENKQEPWKSAFDNLSKETSLDFIPQPFTFISVGPYGANSMGGKEFAESARNSYRCALMWYITRDKRYAEKVIEILNTWSYCLWGFDANNAKLNVGLFGSFFLNAAEIIRHSYSGWKVEDIGQFERMILTVFYPTIEDFFTEANGNWDASIIKTMMCIAIFANDKVMFDRAVERYFIGKGNSGITKYIYSGGQCQESVRDWDHVQLGIGEFAKAAQIAWTQGVDFYSVAQNRLGQGFENTAMFLFGNEISIFGTLSYADREEVRDIYESIYNHYKYEKGIEMPFTRTYIETRTREKSSMGVLTSSREAYSKAQKLYSENIELVRFLSPLKTGALDRETHNLTGDTVLVRLGESIQDAIDRYSGSGKHIVLEKGVYLLEKSLVLKSGIVLYGKGKETILTLKPDITELPVIMNEDKSLHDICIQDLLIEGDTKTKVGFDPNYERMQRSYGNADSREGIRLAGDHKGQMKNISFRNITVQHCTKNGMVIYGVDGLSIINCDLRDNGSAIVPGAGLHHNLKIAYSSNCKIVDSRFVDSLWGNGIELAFSQDVLISGNELARNNLSGLRCVDSRNLKILSNFAEGNDEYGIALDTIKDAGQNIELSNNLSQCNGMEKR